MGFLNSIQTHENVRTDRADNIRDGITWYGWWVGFETTWADSVFATGTWVSNYVGEASKTTDGTYDYVTCNVAYIPDGQPATPDRVVIEVYEGQPKWNAQADAIDQ